ncbi:MAG: hypothetical protein JJU11_04355 [Candidatus Sumerlaeia bacterium]|nr:hypothetical protein [Candidatus Sumerlaeia bacterium]
MKKLQKTRDLSSSGKGVGWCGAIVAISLLMVPMSALSQTVIGSDNAGNYGVTWSNGSNQGTGFGAWAFDTTQGSGFAGMFIGDPGDGGLGGLGDPSFGLYANPQDTGAFAKAIRPFANPLAVGQSFSVQLGMNWDSDGSGNKGLNIVSGGTEQVNVNMGGTSTITVNGTDTGFGYGTDPMEWTFTVLDATTLQVHATPRNSGDSDFTTTVTIADLPTGFEVYAAGLASGANRQPYFNNLQITEPTVDVDPTLDSLTRNSPSNALTNASTLTWLATFSDDVVGVTTSNFSLTTSGGQSSASIASVSDATGDTWEINVNTVAGASGDITLNLANNTGIVADADGSALVTTSLTGQTYNVDRVPPTVSSVSPTENSTHTSLTAVTVNFSESVSGVTAGDLTIDTVPATSVNQSSGSSFTFNFSTPADGSSDFDLDSGSIIDAAGNAFAGYSWSYTIDSSQPGVTLTSSDVSNGGFTNSSSVSFTATFTQGVDPIISGDISVTNGNAGTVTTVSPTEYTFAVTPTSEDVITVQIGAGVTNATAPPNNANAASNSYSFTFDETAPTVITLDPADEAELTSLTQVEITFSESVTGVTGAALEINETAATGVSGSGAGPYTFTFPQPNYGNVDVDLIGSGITDVAGNTVADVSYSYTLNIPSPTIDGTFEDEPIWTYVASATDGEQWEIDFIAEDLYFAEDDTYIYLAATRSGNTDTWAGWGFIIDQGDLDGATDSPWERQMGYAHTNLPDVVLHGNLEGNWSQLYTWDGSALQNVNEDNGSGQSETYTNRTTHGDTAVSAGYLEARIAKSRFSNLGDTIRVQFYIIGNTEAEHGVFDSIPDDVYMDSWNVSGNPTILSNYVTIALNEDPVAPGAPTTPVLDPSEDSGISDSDGITNIAEPTLSGTAPADSTVILTSDVDGAIGSVYTEFGEWAIQTSELSEGTHSITAAAIRDFGALVGPNSAALTVTIDTTAPTLTTVSIASDNSDTSLAKAGDTITVSITANEDITAPTVTIAGQAATVSGSGSSYTATYLVQAGDSGAASISISSFEDTAGNAGATVTSTTDSSTVTIDTAAPTVTIAQPSSPTNQSTITSVAVDFSESITGLGTGSFTTSGITVDAVNGSGASYTIDITLTGADGAKTIQLPADTVTDAAGNGNVASNQVSITLDTAAPTVASRVPAANATISSLSEVSVTFSRSVTGVVAGDLTVNTSAATGVTGSGSGPYVFTGFGAPGDGAVNVDLAAGSIVDTTVGNAFAGASWSYTVDTSGIDVVITSGDVASGGTTNEGSVVLTITFDEAVTGFVQGDLIETNSVLSNFGGSGAVYTVTVTPEGDGTVTVEVPQGVANAVAAPNNPNNSADFSFTSDQTDPVTTLVADAGLVVGTEVGFTFSVVDDNTSGTTLLVMAPGSGTFEATEATFDGNEITYTATASGLHEFLAVSDDTAGNVEAIDEENAVAVVINLAANSPLTLDVAAGTNVEVTFPLAPGINVTMTFAEVTVAGTVTVDRNLGDGNAPGAGLDANKLAGQYFVITDGGGLAFTTATISFDIDEALFGSQLSVIDRVFVLRGSTLSEISGGDLTVVGSEVTVSGVDEFSEWYFGDSTTDVHDWMILMD